MQTMTPLPDASAWDRGTGDDFLLAPPNPAQRISCSIDPYDLRRLDLHAALTAAGIAPLPGDREAIEQLSALPDSVHQALHRWLTSNG
ncbi:hypothetical protein ABZ920_14435 [Streptomyces sp. NPDC046831]|uniref:hypothetical protein n=1 Tax=Streptomyces sp. NPDC046831 TaxID=3154805 RepID=UPI0033E8CEDB